MQIKVSFADTPEVYGEFLTIMKNFKSQQLVCLRLSHVLKLTLITVLLSMLTAELTPRRLLVRSRLYSAERRI